MLNIHIRWMIESNMPDVLAIENQSFEHPWTDQDFSNTLRQRNCIGFVTEIEDEIAGYMIYELNKKTLNLLNIAVNPKFLRTGVGTAMINKLKSKLKIARRVQISADISEKNTNAHFFFKSCNFLAVSVLYDHYDMNRELAAYIFIFSILEQTKDSETFLNKPRFTKKDFHTS